MELSKVTLEIFTKLEQQWLSHYDTSKKIRILSIDGGGITATVASASLLHLENQIRFKTSDPNARISDFFDLITGTGIGAILASMLVATDPSSRPLFSAKEAIDAIANKNPQMFKTTFAGAFFRRRSRRFSGKCMDSALKELFKDLTLKDTCKPLLIPCFDLKSSAPFVFSRADASESASFNFELWKVCRATTSTPSLFKPFVLTSVDGKTCCSAVDGGLVMNNPTAAAVTHVLHNKRDFPSVNGVEDLLVLSLGNGSAATKPRRDGVCDTSAVVEIVLDGVSDTVDQMLGNAFCWNRADYVRIQANGLLSEVVVGHRTEEEGEVLREKGVESLPFGGKRLLTETNGQRIESFVQRLVASGRSSLPPSPCKNPAVSPLAGR